MNLANVSMHCFKSGCCECHVLFCFSIHYMLHLTPQLVDTTPPVISVPSDTVTREVELGTPGTNVFYTEPTASDISGTANLVSRTAQPGDFFPVGQTVVTYTYQDPSGNPATATITVNVVEGNVHVTL